MPEPCAQLEDYVLGALDAPARRAVAAHLERCAVCAGPRFGGDLEPELVRAATLHLRSKPLVLEVKKMVPGEDGSMRVEELTLRASEHGPVIASTESTAMAVAERVAMPAPRSSTGTSALAR